MTDEKIFVKSGIVFGQKWKESKLKICFVIDTISVKNVSGYEKYLVQDEKDGLTYFDLPQYIETYGGLEELRLMVDIMAEFAGFDVQYPFAIICMEDRLAFEDSKVNVDIKNKKRLEKVLQELEPQIIISLGSYRALKRSDLLMKRETKKNYFCKGKDYPYRELSLVCLNERKHKLYTFPKPNSWVQWERYAYFGMNIMADYMFS